MSVLKPEGTDPRTSMEPGALEDANAPVLSPVAMPAGLSPGMKLGFVGIGLLGILTFTTLASSRGDATQAGANPALPVTASVMPVGGVVPKPVLLPGPPELPPPTLIPPPLDVTAPVMGVVASQVPGANRLMSPGVVVDLTKGGAAALPPTPGLAGVKNDDLSADDKFADRVAAAENAPARAVRISNSSYTVPQGAIIAGVLETAINSDLPGYVRAVVSRDVMGFDGRRVLIPSGSRLIGQYRSGLAAGQSRAFIVWTRLTRPDGVTVSLGSPVTDPLGRAGLGGKVDSHFLKRFGSAILLSVVQSGLGLLQRGGNDVVVRTADDAKSVAGIALQRDISIPPTVKVAQGTAIRIFIARDLDFSGTDGGS
ncbi:type IV secretion system protein VirB10 [Sphingorhabdus lacus]|uniref:TrbI/VirB10 family protein n=1 Tax=Sphingorhabdus lacus TaxID=392610 RepID=A0A6I6L8U2_9SPHN|nr:type IV secretion system protein VirB10 [Sphingorhabdus lacus]QGY80497.1 TrbI/VirB10 family protein [Sphingorhabdus lacus]